MNEGRLDDEHRRSTRGMTGAVQGMRRVSHKYTDAKDLNAPANRSRPEKIGSPAGLVEAPRGTRGLQREARAGEEGASEQRSEARRGRLPFPGGASRRSRPKRWITPSSLVTYRRCGSALPSVHGPHTFYAAPDGRGGRLGARNGSSSPARRGDRVRCAARGHSSDPTTFAARRAHVRWSIMRGVSKGNGDSAGRALRYGRVGIRPLRRCCRPHGTCRGVGVLVRRGMQPVCESADRRGRSRVGVRSVELERHAD